MLLLFNRFLEYQFSRIFHSINFVYLALRILRLTLITIGTSSIIYTLKFLSKLRKKRLLLEQCITHRRTLETLITDRTTHDDQLKNQITDLHIEYKHLYDVYVQLDSEENQLSNTILRFIDQQQLLHHSLPIEKNKQELFLPITDTHQDDSNSFISNIATTKVSQSCLSSPSFTKIDSMNIRESVQTNILIVNSINKQTKYRSKNIFTRLLSLKKKKSINTRGDGDA